MILLLLGILFFVYSYLTQKKYSLVFGILVILVIMGFQSNVLSDYRHYQEAYLYIQRYGQVDLRTALDEPLWTGMFYAFSKIVPFWFFILFLSAIQCYILYIFIKKYCKNRYMWLAACLFYFTFNMMLLQMYVIRQSLAINIVLLAFITVDRRKKLWLPLVFSLMAYLIHNSSIVALPFLLLYYYYTRKETGMELNGKFGTINVWPIVMTGAFLILYYVKDRFLYNYLVPLSLVWDDDFRLSSYFDINSDDGMGNSFTISPLIALYDAIIVFLTTWYIRDSSKKMQIFCVISTVTAFGDMLLFGLGSIPRVIMYFALFNLPVYTSITSQLRKQYGAIFALLFIALVMGYAVKTSLPWLLGTDGDKFGNYRFIFMP